MEPRLTVSYNILISEVEFLRGRAPSPPPSPGPVAVAPVSPIYKVEFLRGVPPLSPLRAWQPRYKNPDYIYVGIAPLTLSSHRTGVYVPTASLGTFMSKVHILWVASPYFFYSFPFQMKLVTSADKTPASFIGTPLRNLFLSPWTMLLSAQLLARPLVFFTLLLRLRLFL